MTDYAALKAEIAKPVYSAMTDVQIAASLNTTPSTDEEPVGGAMVGRLWARRGVLGAARERAARTTLTAPQRATAWTAIEMVAQDGFSDLNPKSPAQRAALVAMLDSFVTDTIMNAADKAATLALFMPVRSIAQSIGFSAGVGLSDIQAARAV